MEWPRTTWVLDLVSLPLRLHWWAKEGDARGDRVFAPQAEDHFPRRDWRALVSTSCRGFDFGMVGMEVKVAQGQLLLDALPSKAVRVNNFCRLVLSAASAIRCKDMFQLALNARI